MAQPPAPSPKSSSYSLSHPLSMLPCPLHPHTPYPSSCLHTARSSASFHCSVPTFLSLYTLPRPSIALCLFSCPSIHYRLLPLLCAYLHVLYTLPRTSLALCLLPYPSIHYLVLPLLYAYFPVPLYTTASFHCSSVPTSTSFHSITIPRGGVLPT